MKSHENQTSQSMASATASQADDELTIFLSGEIVPYIITIHSITGTTIAGYLFLCSEDLPGDPLHKPPHP